MIVYFSATGNCAFVAKTLTEATGDRAVSLLDLQTGITLADGEPLGLVTPTYFWGLPSVVDAFLSNVTITGAAGSYLYCVATYGTTTGGVGVFVRRRLAEKGLTLDAGYSVKMPDTWTPTFDLSDRDTVRRINEGEGPQIAAILRHIQARDRGDFMAGRVPLFAAKIAQSFYEKARRTAHLRAEDTCIGCGLCARKCPVKAIEMRDKRPVWVKDQCAMCLGCLHHCPKFSIQYGDRTKRHGQYIHPSIRRQPKTSKEEMNP